MSKQSTTDIMSDVLDRVKAIDPVNVRKWFDDLHITTFDHGLMQIACPDQSCAEYLQDNCLKSNLVKQIFSSDFQ